MIQKFSQHQNSQKELLVSNRKTINKITVGKLLKMMQSFNQCFDFGLVSVGVLRTKNFFLITFIKFSFQEALNSSRKRDKLQSCEKLISQFSPVTNLFIQWFGESLLKRRDGPTARRGMA